MKTNKKHLVDGQYSFVDLVDIAKLKDLFEQFSIATGYTTGLTSYPDQQLLISTGWQDICVKFHRSTPSSEIHCVNSNMDLASKLDSSKNSSIHYCQNGLVDGAIPIIIEGVHVADLFTGQLLFKKPDREYFLAQAKKYKYEDVDGYMEALDKVPIVTEEEFKNALGFLSGMAVMVAEQGLSKLQAEKLRDKLNYANEKSKESDRLKSSFLLNMSHEIRTPMNGIIGFASLLRDPDLNASEQEEFISIIEKNGFILLNVITDLIDVSIIEAGQLEVSLSSFDVNTKFQDILNLYKPEADRRNIELVLSNTYLNGGGHLYTDQEKFYKILTNLIKNALKYTHVGKIEFGYLKKDKKCIFYVKDSGIGIPENRQDSIFDHFIQSINDETDVREGSGVGLTICKAYVEKLGGEIWLDSELDIGSQFYFSIPDIQEQ